MRHGIVEGEDYSLPTGYLVKLWHRLTHRRRDDDQPPPGEKKPESPEKK